MSRQSASAYRCSQQQKRQQHLSAFGLSRAAQLVVRCEVAPAVVSLEDTWQRLIAAHAILSVELAGEAGRETLQVSMEGDASGFSTIELAAEAPADRSKTIASLAERECELVETSAPRVRLLLLSDSRSAEGYLILTAAAACCDSGSLQRLLRDLLGSSAPRAPAAGDIDYFQYAEWQDSVMHRPEVHEFTEYWRQQRSGGAHPLSFMPAWREAGARCAPAVAAKNRLPEELSARLRTLAARLGVSPATVVRASVVGLLGRLSGAGSFTIGVDFDGRTMPELQRTLGPLHQVLPVAMTVAPQDTVETLVARVAEKINEAADRQDFVDWGQLLKDFGDSQALLPLCIEWHDLERYPEASPFEILELHDADAAQEVTLRLLDDGVVIQVQWLCMPQKRGLVYVAHLAQQWRSWLATFVADSRGVVAALPLCSGPESDRVSKLFPGKALPAGDRTSVLDLIDDHAANAPDAIALRDESGVLTYAMLKRYSSVRAAQMRAQVQYGLVGVDARFSPDTIILMIAAMRAGLTYVPVDMDQPLERLESLLVGDSPLVIFGTVSRAGKDSGRIRYVRLQECAASVDCRVGVPIPIAGEAAAYVVTTSGSTGKPKGVCVSHESLLRSTLARLEYYREPVKRFLLLSPFYVDSSIAGIYWTLCSGGELLVPSEDTRRDARRINSLIPGTQTSHLLCIPSLYQLLLGEPQSAECDGVLETAIVAAETCHAELVSQHDSALPRTRLYNEYGPSEATVWASVFSCQGMRHNRVPIGYPAPHASVYVLDDRAEPAAIGQAGELYIGGAIASGYWGNPQETARRFIPDALSGIEGSRLYKSGDFGSWCADGALLFSGRRDEQVKILGHRIELSEIRQAIDAYPEVRESWALRVADRAEIVAFVVWKDAGSADPTARLSEHLQRVLPRFMVPQRFVALAALPRLPGGKVDARRLSELEISANVTAASAEPIDDPLEALIGSIWQHCVHTQPRGRRDSFFALGGNSLNGIQVIARVQEALQTDRITIRHLFEHPVLANFVDELRKLQAEGQGVTEVPREEPLMPSEGPPRSESTPRPEGPLGSEASASFFQERLFFLHSLDPDSAAYNCPFAIRLEGMVDAQRIEASLRYVVEKHSVLRTTLQVRSGALKQIVGTVSEFTLRQVDLSMTGESVDDAIMEAGALPFDLELGSLIRATLYKVGREQFVLVVVVHHAVFDGWSLGILVSDFKQHYCQPGLRHASRESAESLSYADYAEWQRRQWNNGVWQAQLSYWVEMLREAPGRLDLPTDRPRAAVQRFNGETLHFEWPETLSAHIRTQCLELNITPFMFFEALFAVLLHRYTGQVDIVIGTPVANRRQPATQALMGPVANSVAIRNRLDPARTWSGLLAQVRSAVLGAYCNQDVPFEKVVEALQPIRSLTHSPLFQAMIVMQNIPVEPFELQGLRCTLLPHRSRSAKLDMTLSLFEQTGAFSGQLEYNSELFGRGSMRRLLQNLEQTAQAVLRNPQCRLRDLDLISAGEQQRLRELCGARTRRGEPPALGRPATLTSLFEAQAQRSPDALAVSFEGAGLTYAQLDERANQSANYLLSRGVARDTPVAVLMERSLELMITLLGILKAGCAYMPLDCEWPIPRLDRLWKRTGRPWVITDLDRRSRPPFEDKEICWEREGAVIGKASRATPQAGIEPEQLAYVIHTSGSTGEPKGVMIPHAGIVNRLGWMQHALQLSPGDAVLQKTSYTFDVSVWELFWPLLEGGRVVLALPGQQKDPLALNELLTRERIAFAHFVPSMLSTFMQIAGFEDIPALRAVVCSGEALDASLCERFFAQAHGTKLYNMYGPTEASVDVSSWECVAGETTVPIGRPIDGIRLPVLGTHLGSVPLGASGELHIGGVGLARGYLSNPVATAAAFVPDAMAEEPGTRLYRSGDLARYREDGAIEFLGRRDNQIKLRGYRIELGEIEHALLTSPGVTDGVVIHKHGGASDSVLLAYVTGEVVPHDLRRHLTTVLPSYMVPGHIAVLDSFPRLSSGKVDRSLLAQRTSEPARQASAPFIARTETEEALSTLWKHHLRADSIDAGLDFFSAGGHSLAAVALLSDINGEFRIRMPLQVLLESGSFSDLASRIDGLRCLQSPGAARATELRPLEVEGSL